ncbi:hypothetical protein SAMN04487969_103192 [Paenibacillus algorifonticola]|uniref:Lipoprotein n=1 Tax=Paenibacillus algorifonticola TaxID=684063 RepID=A0A1I2BA25_9BACL|nr:hypothetical protein [Paenibacillus algorifonticola]SFE52153.1 hypothetical protein SAMN04487969_103192 [Paenibacillus algorifonticola]
MKKMIFAVAAMLVMAGCSASPAADSSAEVSQLKEQVSQLSAENEKLKAELAETADTAAVSGASSEPEPEPSANTGSVLELKKALVIADFAEVTLTKTEFTSKVVPPKPDSFYTYYEVKDAENIYLDVVLKFKSLLSSSKSADDFASVQVKYDSKYEYESFSTIEESGGSNFTYTNITSIEPLKTGVLHFIAELPKEAAKDKKPIDIIVTIEGKEYVYSLRSE